MSFLAPGVADKVAFLHGKTLEDLLSGNVATEEPSLDGVADVQWTDVAACSPWDNGTFTIRRYEPNTRTNGARPSIVWAHGGAWVAGAIDTPEGHLVPAELCHRLDAIVYSVGYRLAPAHPYPAAMNDVVAAFDLAVADHGVDPNRVVLGGASAGGNLAASACQIIRDRGSAAKGTPCAALLVYPATNPVDGPYKGERPAECPELLWFDRTLAGLGFTLYLGGADPSDTNAAPYAQPAKGDLAGLPPTLVTTAAVDALEPQAIDFVERLQSSGNNVTHHRVKGVLHGYLGHFNEIAASREALDRHVGWLAAQLSVGSTQPTQTIVVKADDGADLFVALDGPPDAEPVLILHGYLGDGSQWSQNVESLVDAGYQVVRVDHRGHGRSSNIGDEAGYSMDQLMDDALAVMTDLGILQFHLVGHSMGGLVAELIAIHHQDRLLSLVLVDCSPIGGQVEKPFWTKARSFAGHRIGPSRLLRTLRPVAARMPFIAKGPQERAKVRAALEVLQASVDQHDPAAFVALGHELATHRDLRPYLGSITVPTTVVVGENEFAKLRRGADALAEGIAGAQLEVIPESGHSPPMDNPDAFNDVLADHLRRARPQPRA